MPPLSAYTHFESLLFFQCLVSLDARPTDFSAISDTLQNNKFIKEDDAFDTNRLSPQALEELYTSLLKEELNEPLSTNGHSQDGTTTISKKRKVSSNEPLPQPPAARIAGLVSQLYARYKDRVTREIREEEKKFQDISQEIERLHNDAVLESQIAAPSEEKAVVGPPVVAVDQSQGRDGQKSVMPTQKEASTVKTAEQSLPDVQAHPAITTQQSPLPPPAVIAVPLPAKSDIAVPTSDTFKGQVPQLAISQPRNVEPQQPQASQLPRVSQSPQQQLPLKQALSTGQPPAVPVAATTPMGLTGNGPFYVPPQQNQSIPQLLPNFQVKVPPPPQPQRPPPQASPRGHATARNQPNLPPGSTIVFQAQQGIPTPATPAGSQHSSLGGPGYGRGTPLPAGSLNPPQIPPGQQQFQQWVGHPQADRIPATPLAPSPYVNQPMMPRQGTLIQRDVPGKPIMVPQSHEQPTPAKVPPMEIQTPQAQISMQKPPSTLGSSLSGLKQQRPHRSSMDTSGSLTPWKRTPNLRLNIPDTPRSPPRPRAEDISPISTRSASPVETSEITPAPSRRRGRGRKQSPSSDLDIATKKSEHLTTISLTKRTGRSASTRSRARSVASRDEEIALESGTTHRKIKDEAPSTPAGASEDAEVETRSGSRRKAAAVVMGDEVPLKTRGKRKRGASEGLEPDIIRPTPSRGGSSQLVYCTRNFTRTGAPIMNDVAAHKHASIFAKPLTEREAPGYKDLIYRPQDLKSIKSALNQGNRAAAAATEAASSSSSTAVDGDSPMPGSGAPSKNAAWLAKTPELIPPKAIVNSSQLEKELIRMFANAIMFNPAPDAERGFGPSFQMIKSGGGPSRSIRASSRAWDLDEGGISRDTREMCDDVEKAVTKWRAAERTTSTDETSNKTTLSLRGSSGESNVDTADDHK